MNKWIVLDVNNLAHRSFHSMGKLSFKGRPTNVLFGIFRDILDLRDLFNTDKFAFCFDSSSSKRKEIYSDYKGNRKIKEESEGDKKARVDLYIQIEELFDILPDIGFQNVFEVEGYEADDIIASICYDLDIDDEVIIVSTDQDLYQLLSVYTISIYNPIKKKVITEEWFIKEYEINPSKWSCVKAIAGCSSDNIIGAFGVGEKTAIKYLNEKLKRDTKAFESIAKVLNTDFERNMKLVDLPYSGMPKVFLESDDIEEEDWQKVMKELGMKSLFNRDFVIGN